MASRDDGTRMPAGAAVAIFVGLAGVACAITLVYLGMRSVMDVGGFCAEGGPYVIGVTCPKGVAGLMIGGIWGGFLFGAVYAWQAFKHGVPNFVALLWSALFLPLGWNFLVYGLDAPGDAGLAWGWLVCAILFFLMGALPLIGVLPWVVRSFTGRTSAGGIGDGVQAAVAGIAAMRRGTKRGTSGSAASAGDPTASSSWDTPTPPADADVVTRLERLDALHRSGALDDAEFERAKDEVLRGGG